MIRNIVFDMGQVLLTYNPMLPCIRYAETEEDARRVCEALFRAPEWSTLYDGGEIDDAELLKIGQSRLETPRLKALAAEIMTDWYLDCLWPTKGMNEIIEDMLAQGYRLYVLSNAASSFHLYEYKIPHIRQFSGVLVSAEERMLKPNREIYLRLFEKFSLIPEECLFIDDLPQNVAGAEAAGMRAYCFADGDARKLHAFLQSLNKG